MSFLDGNSFNCISSFNQSHRNHHKSYLTNKQTRTPTTYKPLGIGFLFTALIPPFIRSSEYF